MSSVTKQSNLRCVGRVRWVVSRRAWLIVALILLAGVFGSQHGLAQDATMADVANRPLWIANVAVGGGYFPEWKNANQLALDLANEYEARDVSPFYRSLLIGVERQSRSGRTAFGLKYYHYVSSRRFDTTYVDIDDPSRELFLFDEFSIDQGSNVYGITGRVRLLQRRALRIDLRGFAGFSYIFRDAIEFDANGFGRPQAITFRNSNKRFMELHTQVSAEGTLQINPFYAVFGNIAYDYEATTQSHIGIRLAAGLRFYLRKEGVPMSDE